MIWRAGTDTTCDYFNHAWLAFTGRALEEELGNGWAEGVHPEDRELCVQAYLAAFHARVPFVLQYRLRRHDGAFRWILDHGRPYDDVEGQFAGYLGGCYDITEQMQAAAMAARLEGVVLTAREIAHHLNNDLQGPTILLESLQNDPYLPPAVQALMHVGATGLASAVTHLQQLQRVVRVETRPTPLGPALDLARSTAEERD
jgi:PAS domain S-box-containing protein